VTAIYKINNGDEEGMDSKIRILLSKTLTVPLWQITDDVGATIVTVGQYGYAGHLDDPITPTFDLNFNVPGKIYCLLSNPYPLDNLFTVYWRDYMAEITNTDSKLFTCYMRLTKQDIFNLDFADKIFLDGSKWTLNRVMDYNPQEEGVTQVELLKLINP
jgi:hypothetical protein